MVLGRGPHSEMPSSGRNLWHWELSVMLAAGLPTMAIVSHEVFTYKHERKDSCFQILKPHTCTFHLMGVMLNRLVIMFNSFSFE